MARFLEQKTERRVQLAKGLAEYDGRHSGDERRPRWTLDYPIRDDNRPRTLLRRPDERYSRPDVEAMAAAKVFVEDMDG